MKNSFYKTDPPSTLNNSNHHLVGFLIHQKQIPKSLNWQTSNDVNLAANEASFATA
jgi:hypothetical protein